MTTNTLLAPPKISSPEFKQRIERARELMREQNLDVLLVNANEADAANVRYFSDYWTLFEMAGVAITAHGAALLIGPESGEYARDRSEIPDIYKLVEYRESADPQYPGVSVSTFESVFKDLGVAEPKRIGIGGYLVTTVTVIDSLRKTFPGAEIGNADPLMLKMRSIKSPAEIACLEKACHISDIAVETILGKIHPGMTEQQAVGIIQEAFYANGAEYEGHPTYVLSGRSSSHAISRPTPKVMQKGELVQLNIGARVAGYSSSVGLPICLGKMSDDMRRLVEFGLEAHEQTIAWLKGRTPASEISINYHQLFVDRGFKDNFLYGPCHGLGLMEVEQPWMEETSTYNLEPNMTFQVDTFLEGPEFGLRWENGGRVTDGAFDLFSGKYRRIFELE
ncbi:MAG: aminopeptidase P family protein [Phycisphaeraceae bacterium]|nr:aminopeptidase P family protein [Phycisphaeraceae bacterium]